MARPRDYAREYRRRQRLAHERGFSSLAEQRRFSRPTTVEGFLNLPKRALERVSEVDRVLRTARSRRTLSAEEVAAELGVPMSAVQFWAGPALGSRRGGRTPVRRGDRLPRLRPLVSEGEARWVVVRGSEATKRAERAFAAQWRFVEGDPAAAAELRALQGVRVAGQPIETDPVVLKDLANRRALAPERY
jgi:hypothetical protein